MKTKKQEYTKICVICGKSFTTKFKKQIICKELKCKYKRQYKIKKEKKKITKTIAAPASLHVKEIIPECRNHHSSLVEKYLKTNKNNPNESMTRKCLKCDRTFVSTWIGNRLCSSCITKISNYPDIDAFVIAFPYNS